MKRRLPTSESHRVLTANPVVLLPTRSGDGVDNVAPNGMCMPVSTDPPLGKGAQATPINGIAVASLFDRTARTYGALKPA